MKKRSIAILLAGVLACSFILPGCGDSDESATAETEAEETETPTPTATATPEVTVTPPPAVTETPEATPEPTEAPSGATALEGMPYIGRADFADWGLILTNQTGQDIISVQFCDSDQGNYLENALPEGEVFSSGESRAVFLDIPVLDEVCAGTVATASTAHEILDPAGISTDALPALDILLTFADGTGHVIHYFDYTDMDAADIYYQDGYVYLDYISVETGAEWSNYDGESSYGM